MDIEKGEQGWRVKRRKRDDKNGVAKAEKEESVNSSQPKKMPRVKCPPPTIGLCPCDFPKFLYKHQNVAIPGPATDNKGREGKTEAKQ